MQALTRHLQYPAMPYQAGLDGIAVLDAGKRVGSGLRSAGRSRCTEDQIPSRLQNQPSCEAESSTGFARQEEACQAHGRWPGCRVNARDWRRRFRSLTPSRIFAICPICLFVKAAGKWLQGSKDPCPRVRLPTEELYTAIAVPSPASAASRCVAMALMTRTAASQRR